MDNENQLHDVGDDDDGDHDSGGDGDGVYAGDHQCGRSGISRDPPPLPPSFILALQYF